MAWMLNLAYLCVGLLVSPWLVYRRLVLKKRLGDWQQKLLGELPQRSRQRPCLWVHAVSVGEVVQLKPVLEELTHRLPDHELWITTTTVTGHEVARKLYPQYTVSYFPLDFSWSVARALDRVYPTAIVLVELELWPNFIAEAHRRQIPVLLINGRISEKSFLSYRWIRPLLKRVLPCLDVIAVQNQTYADRLLELGAESTQITVTGSIKFDRVETNRQNPRTLEIGRSFGLTPSHIVLIAGSTQSPEEELALTAYQTLRPEFPSLRLIIVPRHKERFEEVATLVERAGLPLLRRSQVMAHQHNDCLMGGRGSRRATQSPGSLDASGSAGASPCKVESKSDMPPVLLLDTLGELSAAWGLADIAFVGGSLTKRGGQNMIEPAGYGAAVLFGPHTHNFKDVVALLLDAQAAQVILQPEAFTASIRGFLTDPQSAQSMGRHAQTLVTSQSGATTKTVGLILTALKAHPECSPDRAAA